MGICLSCIPAQICSICISSTCFCVKKVHRICFALFMFHLVMVLIVYKVENTTDKRACAQNDYWTLKTITYVLFVVLSFLIPNGFFIFWSNYLALLCAFIFVIIQLVLLVDFSHTVSETCIEKYETEGSDRWKYALIGTTLGCYLVSFVLTVVLYIYFGGTRCKSHTFYITFNLVMAIIATSLSIHPEIQDKNPRSGIMQSAIVVLYCTYLVSSAIVTEPRNENNEICNPLSRIKGTTATTIVMGSVFTILSIVYSTSRAATQSSTLIGNKEVNNNKDEQETLLLEAEEPSETAVRQQAIRNGIDSGALSTQESTSIMDDEKKQVAYSYAFFHIIFMLAAMYVAMLLTNWNTVNTTINTQYINNSSETIVVIGRSYAAMWCKIISSWLSYILYMWTLVAPLVFPERFEY